MARQGWPACRPALRAGTVDVICGHASPPGLRHRNQVRPLAGGMVADHRGRIGALGRADDDHRAPRPAQADPDHRANGASTRTGRRRRSQDEQVGLARLRHQHALGYALGQLGGDALRQLGTEHPAQQCRQRLPGGFALLLGGRPDVSGRVGSIKRRLHPRTTRSRACLRSASSAAQRSAAADALESLTPTSTTGSVTLLMTSPSLVPPG